MARIKDLFEKENKRVERKVARIYNMLKLSIFSFPSFILTFQT